MDYNTRWTQLSSKSTDDVFNQADVARKLLVLNCETSESTSSKDAVSFILHNDWNRYADCTSEGEIYDGIIKRLTVKNNSAQWKTNISLFAKNTPKPLNLEDQFAMFSEVFNVSPGYVPPKTNNIDTSKSITNNRIDTNKRIINNRIDISKSSSYNKLDTNLCSSSTRNDKKLVGGHTSNITHKAREQQEDLEPPQKFSVFKTARDELNLQNIKKYGKNAAVLESAPKRRRLGNTRIYVGNKFVSPMLSNNESSGEDAKSQEWSEDIADERLKNIDPKMVELIRSEIMDCGTTIEWNDIAGLEFAKTAIQEAVVWPMLRPDIFTGLRRPPKGILLFGPPGTGKTLIGKCVASQSKSTFFSISASSLTSKWIGDGEKMVRALFTVARCHQPAVIFIDEIDSLLSQRSDNEHESSRRIKTEFLVQLDGATTDNEERLLLIGATNRPQELDEAARRRFVKRLYIPLPEIQGRFQLVSKLMSKEKHNISEVDLQNIARLSDGYSGADMRNLCADASMGPIRSIDIAHMQSIQAQEVRPVSMDDFKKSLSRVRPSVSPNDLDQYLVWDKTYGSGLC